MPRTFCPNGDAAISVKQPRTGSAVKCWNCDTEMEVICTNPLEVEFPLDYGEDWDNEEDAWEGQQD